MAKRNLVELGGDNIFLTSRVSEPYVGFFSTHPRIKNYLTSDTLPKLRNLPKYNFL